MTTDHVGVPSASARLSMFRAGRLDDGVQSVNRCAQSFRDEVDTSLSGTRGEKESLRSLSKAFVASYHAFSESLDAARVSGVIDGATIDVLEGIMRRMKAEYSSGLDSLRKDVARLDEASPAFREFSTAASDKIDRLEQFWQTTYQHAPKFRM
jgi:hypothetical protein